MSLMSFLMLPKNLLKNCLKNRRFYLLSATLSLSWLGPMGGGVLYKANAAIAANPTVPYAQAAAASDFALHQCESDSDSSALLSLFDQAAIAAAEREIPHIADLAERGDALHRIGASYACLGEREKAATALMRALQVVSEIEDEVFRAQLSVTIAETYARQLNDVAGTDTALEQAFSVVRGSSLRRFEGGAILLNSARLYVELGEFEKLPAVVEMAIDDQGRTRHLNAIAEYSTVAGTAADNEQIAQLFPDWERQVAIWNDSSSPLPLIAYQLETSEPQGILDADDPAAAIDAYIAEQVAMIDALPDDYSRELAYGILGGQLLHPLYHEIAVPFLERAAVALPTISPDSELVEAATAQLVELEELHFHIHLSVGRALLILDRSEEGRAVITDALARDWFATTKVYWLVQYAGASVPEELAQRERAFLLSQAEALLPAVRAETSSILSQIEIAQAFVVAGESAAARQITDPLVDRLLASDPGVVSHSGLPYLLLTLGDYEKAVLVARQLPDEAVLSSLVGQLMSLQQEPLALEVLDSLTAILHRTNAIADMIAIYSELNRPQEALQLAEQALQQIQSIDPLADEAYNNVIIHSDAHRSVVFDQTRLSLAQQILYPTISLFDEDVVMSALSSPISDPTQRDPTQRDPTQGATDSADSSSLGYEQLQRVFDSIEDPTLRIGSSLYIREPSLVLEAVGNDLDTIVAHDLPDQLLITLAQLAVHNDRLSQSNLFIEAVRSPYARTLALTY